MDRGFYALDLLESWRSQNVRFIARVRRRSLRYRVTKHLSRPRRLGSLELSLDARVRLGKPEAKARPRVRLLRAILPSGEELILATDRFDWPAERVFAAYKKRWHIERFHRLLKDSIGLAHLYSFHQTGLEFLVYTALLLALLLLMLESDSDGETIAILARVLREVRAQLGLATAWKRNMYTKGRRGAQRGQPAARNP